MITGPSVHNQRIERLWRDVYSRVLSYYYNLFYFMEDEGILDPLNDFHVAALHYVFLSKINEKLQLWRGLGPATDYELPTTLHLHYGSLVSSKAQLGFQSLNCHYMELKV